MSDSDSVQDAVRIGGAATLLHIGLTRASFKRGSGAITSLQTVDVKIMPGYALHGAVLDCQLKYEVRVRSGRANVASLGCEYEAQFELPEEFTCTDTELVAFGNVTVLRAVHPYLRELASSSFARLGMPPVTVDLLKIPVL